VVEVPLIMEVIQKLDQTSLIRVEESEPQHSMTNPEELSREELRREEPRE